MSLEPFAVTLVLVRVREEELECARRRRPIGHLSPPRRSTAGHTGGSMPQRHGDSVTAQRLSSRLHEGYSRFSLLVEMTRLRG